MADATDVEAKPGKVVGVSSQEWSCWVVQSNLRWVWNAMIPQQHVAPATAVTYRSPVYHRMKRWAFMVIIMVVECQAHKSLKKNFKQSQQQQVVDATRIQQLVADNAALVAEGVAKDQLILWLQKEVQEVVDLQSAKEVHTQDDARFLRLDDQTLVAIANLSHAMPDAMPAETWLTALEDLRQRSSASNVVGSKIQALLAMYQRETFIQGLLGGQPPEMSEDAPKVWWRRCNNVTAVGAAWTWQKGTPCIRSRRDSTASPDKVLELGTHQVKGLHMS
eukprot:jgi/Chrzof1/11641/Cz06g03110.t1